MKLCQELRLEEVPEMLMDPPKGRVLVSAPSPCDEFDATEFLYVLILVMETRIRRRLRPLHRLMP
jgi:hypothetical protein